MNKKDKIFLAGHNGLVGNSMLEQLHHHGYTLAFLWRGLI